MSNNLNPDQARQYVGPDLGPNCLQKVSRCQKSSLAWKELHLSSLNVHLLSVHISYLNYDKGNEHNFKESNSVKIVLFPSEKGSTVKGKYRRLSLSRSRLSLITAYLEVKICSLPTHENVTTAKKYCGKRGKIAPKEQFLLFSTIFSP